MDVHTQFIEGFTDERYPLKGTTAGIDRSVLGSYELHAPWSLGMPYPPIARR